MSEHDDTEEVADRLDALMAAEPVKDPDDDSVQGEIDGPNRSASDQ